MTNKLLWGVLAFSPWIIFITIVPILLFGFHIAPAFDETGKLDLIGKVYGIGLNLCILFVFLCYFIHIGKIKDMEKEKKWLWRGLMFLGHVFTIPIFWYLYVWRDGPSNPSFHRIGAKCGSSR